MLLLVADENFNNDIVRGLLRRKPDLDIVRVQDVGLSGADDPTLLAWAAQNHRVMLTHDAATMTYFAYERARAGLSMPGVLRSVVSCHLALRLMICCGLLSAVWMVSGKDRFGICHYVKQITQLPTPQQVK